MMPIQVFAFQTWYNQLLILFYKILIDLNILWNHFSAHLKLMMSFWSIKVNGNLAYLRKGGMYRISVANEPKFRCLGGEQFWRESIFTLFEIVCFRSWFFFIVERTPRMSSIPFTHFQVYNKQLLTWVQCVQQISGAFHLAWLKC